MTRVRPVSPAFAWADPIRTIGITGTNGKTSTTHLLEAILRAAGHSVLRVSTLGYAWPGHDYEHLDPSDPAATTATDVGIPITDDGFFGAAERAIAAGARWAVLEATSYGLGTGFARRWRFDEGIFTNLDIDHLASHGSFERYLAAKAQLFLNLGPGRTAVLNADDPHAAMIARVTPPDVRLRWFSAEGEPSADLAASRMDVGLDGTRVELLESSLAEALGGCLHTRMIGEVFGANALAAAVMADAVGIDAAAIRAGLAACPVVPGRFEIVAHEPLVVVDYAHSPEAIDLTIAQARRLARGRVVVVGGAGGSCSSDKRGPMGTAMAHAHRVIVTSDNPRWEDPADVARPVAEAVRREGTELVVELDRATAIAIAIRTATPDDIIVIVGKGHETWQVVRGVTLPFSDQHEARRIAAERRAVPESRA